MNVRTLRIGIVGTGVHANSHGLIFRKIKPVVLTACCDIDKKKAKAFAERHGIGAIYTDYEKMFEREELDAVANVTPDAFHAPVAIAAARCGLHVLCEKPLATNLADAKKMLAAVEKAGVINMVNFSYRDSSALQKATKVVASGKIGRIIHVEASYLQSWLVSKMWGDWKKDKGLTWRLSTAHGSGGTLGDLGCHIYDMASMLAGDIAEVHCRLKTFDKGIKRNRIGKYLLDANDSFTSSVIFKNGALGVIHSSRWATGHANSLRIRAYGDSGAIEVDLDRSMNEYYICTGARDIDRTQWKTVKCRPTPNNQERFIKSIRTGKRDPQASDFAGGVKIQSYLHWSFESHRKGASMTVKNPIAGNKSKRDRLRRHALR